MNPRKLLLYIAATITACTAIVTAWVQIGGPIPASQLYVTQSGDDIKEDLGGRLQKVEVEGKKQTEESAKWGRKIYTQELRSLLILPRPENLEQRQLWRDSIDDAKRNQKFYTDKEIELRK